MTKRIIGIDVARALAVIGMIIVNFKIVLGEKGLNWVVSFAHLFDGKAAATFVVLAGVGLALMTNSAIRNNDKEKLKIIRNRIAKRALFLFIVGISYIVIWPADILHFYGVYMLITLLLLTSNKKMTLIIAAAFIMLYPFLLGIWDYETAWNFTTLDYSDFWTFKGFIRNLFINGFHPVIPWTAFMLFGFWFGKQDLQNGNFVKKAFVISTIVFIAIQIFSHLLISTLSGGDQQTAKALTDVLGTNPMPPLPLYMLNGIAIATSIISACILIAKKIPDNKIIDALNKTGQLALTFYVGHVIVGMGVIEIINPSKMGSYPVEFSVAYALVFSLLCILFAVIWLKNKKSGPLEWLMHKLID